MMTRYRLGYGFPFFALLSVCGSAFSQPATAADLLFGMSVEDPSCAGSVSMTARPTRATYEVKAIDNSGTSLDPNYSFIESVWPEFIAQATYAVIANDDKGLSSVYEQLLTMAQNEVALSTISKKDTEICYKNGKGTACNFRSYEMAFQYFSFYSYVAYIMKPYIDQQPGSKVIREYLREGHKKYIKTFVDPKDPGIFALLGGYISTYSYAKFMGDENLARSALKGGLSKIRNQLKKDGLVSGSSSRGVRSFFYHTFAVNSILAFGELVELNGIAFYDDPKLGPRVRKAVELAVTYASDPKSFEKKGFEGSRRTIDYSTDERDAKRSVHSQALSTSIIIQKRYPGLLDDITMGRYFPTKDFWYFTDLSVGMVPRCLSQ